jgi:Flp pilus assembly protein TadG
MMSPMALLACRRGAAAAEMALVTPLLVVILIGSVELGSYFYNEHILAKAVRDGARYAGRQNFSYYDACSGAPTGPVVAETRALVRTSLLAGGSDRFADIEDGDIILTTRCETTATDLSSSTANMTGIYRGRATGAPVVTVQATVDYAPVIGAPFGFSGVGIKLNASQQSAVMGL